MAQCNLSAAGLSHKNLRSPLIDRSERKYYLPFYEEKQTQKLLEINTGMTITWLENSAEQLEVKAVDESHLATTKIDHSSTSVFSLSSLVHQSAFPPKKTSLLPTHPLPCITHQHPTGTKSVVAGCGLLVTTSISTGPASPAYMLKQNYTPFTTKTAFGSPFSSDSTTVTTTHIR
ncbi:hypothetical protein Pelo_8011 [Pelomyxa schiedti]|nr:hypothetical protein Pelo_8011 [Pelomyxa schiedti]